MKENRTLVVLVVDNSGSMSSIREDMEGGLNTFLEEQRAIPGECFISYYPFDSEILSKEKKEQVLLKDFKRVHITPRGSTALYDTVCGVIDEVGKQLTKIAEEKRPSQVVFVIITDGMENASREFTGADVKNRIEHQESVYNWKFIYLGANQDAYSVADIMGMKKGDVMTYATSSAGIGGMSKGLSSSVNYYRTATNLSAKVAFTDEQKSAALGEK